MKLSKRIITSAIAFVTLISLALAQPLNQGGQRPEGGIPPEKPDGMPGEPPGGFGGFPGGPGGNPMDGNGGPGFSSTILPTCDDSSAKTVTYSYVNSKGTTATYYAKYLADGSTLELSNETIEVDSANEIAVLCINGGKVRLTNCSIIKNGSGKEDQGSGIRSDDYNFYGINNAVVAIGEGSEIVLSDCKIQTTGEFANAVFATDGGVINIENGITISTMGNSARGLFASYQGSVFANDGGVEISTEGMHCAPLATDRGGGTVVVGNSKTAKKSVLNSKANDSPCIYSTGTISGWNISGTCKNGQAVVIEGNNTVELYNSDFTGGRDGQGCIMLYQSMSGDAADSDATAKHSTFNATNCTFVNSLAKSGESLFYVTNTNAVANVSACKFQTEVLAKCESNQWGKSGSNGGTFTLNAPKDTLEGKVCAVESDSSITIKCKKNKVKKVKGNGTIKF